MNNKKYIFMGIVIGLVSAFGFSSVANGVANAFNYQPVQNLNTNQKVNEIIGALNANYVDDIDLESMEEGLYAGLVAGVGDRYTVYMNPEEYAKFMEDSAGVYSGLGIMVEPSPDNDNKIDIVAPFAGAPAEKAGLLPDDKIIKVNGFDVYGDKLDEAVGMMKGPAGTSVTLTIYRPLTGETFDSTIVRADINVPTVSHEMLDEQIGYIKISQFEGVTYNQFAEAYNDLVRQGQKGLIIDLRNNPGGLMDVVCRIADVLCPEGTIVYTEDKQGRQQFTKSDAASVNVPLVILVNGYSASASEILAGAVKDLNVGKLVGTTTYGKGLVQTMVDLSDGSALKVTIQKYYTPSGVCIQGIGIEPDYIVELPEELQMMLNPEKSVDTQLHKAISVLQDQL